MDMIAFMYNLVTGNGRTTVDIQLMLRGILMGRWILSRLIPLEDKFLPM